MIYNSPTQCLVTKIRWDSLGCNFISCSIFSNQVYIDILKHLKEKGVVLERLAKGEKIAELDHQKIEKLKPRIDMFKDPQYHESLGIHQGWLIQVFSYTTLAGQKINRTVIIFTKSVPKQENPDG